uniref:Uncharacterized protein n=1 Tax=Salix viminalis TaxID=40686 RepID=A0A6N2N130_SALVM
MASLKAEKSVGTQLFGQAKKEPAKLTDSTSKTTASKPAAKKAAQKPQEPKKKEASQRRTKLAVKCISWGMDEVIVPCYI